MGMGVKLAEAFPVAKAVFEEVDAALSQNLFDLMANGPAEELTLTQNTQPALMAVSVAAFRVLQDEGLTLKSVKSLAGHSLGEYSAYCVAGALSLTDTARLLRLRGSAMQAAVAPGDGAMAAILGLSLEEVEDIIAPHGAEIANDNAPGQVVISGYAAAVDAACAAAKEAGVKRALKLEVSAPFHCSLMKSAQEQMAEALEGANIAAPQAPVFSNVTATQTSSPDDIRRTLTAQVTGRVRWTESVQAMITDGTDLFIEVGAGKVLSGLVRRIEKGVPSIAVGEPGDLAGYRDQIAH